jgi:hypothetical protein
MTEAASKGRTQKRWESQKAQHTKKSTWSTVNAKGYRGRTPFHLAAIAGHKEIAELLIANGADINAKMEDDRTPLDWAYGETPDLLRKHGGKTGEELKAEGK